MSGVAPGLAALLMLLVWSAALVRAVTRGSWLSAAAMALPGALLVIVAAQAIGGRWPAFYGVLLGMSLFIAGAMVTIGVLMVILCRLAGPEC